MVKVQIFPVTIVGLLVLILKLGGKIVTLSPGFCYPGQIHNVKGIALTRFNRLQISRVHIRKHVIAFLSLYTTTVFIRLSARAAYYIFGPDSGRLLNFHHFQYVVGFILQQNNN